MKLTVKLFAGARDAVGERELDLDLPGPVTAGELLTSLAGTYPRLTPLVDALRLAVNREYAERSRVLGEGDEVALIPPVSGGADRMEVTAVPLSVDGVVRAVSRPTSGAVATFVGVVRESSRGRQVRSLEYDAYPEMATAKMREIATEIRQRWPVDDVAIVHRTGLLGIGEASVVIAVSSAHRKEALAACAFAIERLKAIVPIWKKEIWTDGSEWIGSTVEEYREGQS
jgi:molybdopterin synthase catalytic subunit